MRHEALLLPMLLQASTAMQPPRAVGGSSIDPFDHLLGEMQVKDDAPGTTRASPRQAMPHRDDRAGLPPAP